MDYINTLSKDPILKKLIETQGPIFLEYKKNCYLSLIKGIISQQISTKVAQIIYDRFITLLDTNKPSLKQILQFSVQDLRNIGLSQQKANYVLNVVLFFQEHTLTDEKINRMEDEEIIKLLTQIKGVGVWSVQMLLMFALQRANIFSIDDFGIQKTMRKLYLLEHLEKKELKQKLTTIAETWTPYKTYACRYLWGSLDINA